jgi:hypothetical protein
LSLITDLSLITIAKDTLPIIGHHLVERATDFVLDKTVAGVAAIKDKLLSTLRLEKSGKITGATLSKELSTDVTKSIALMEDALKKCKEAELATALATAEATVATLVRAEFKLSEDKAREYSVAITREIKIAVGKK